jgi:integrase
VFARWLVEREIIETNPVRDVAAAPVRRRSITMLDSQQVRTLVDGLPQPYRAFEALLAGTGMEFSAAAQVRRRDLDTDSRVVFANGEKNEYRTRYVEVTEEWAWAIVTTHAHLLAPNAPLFPGIREDAALAQHHAAARRLGLPRSTLHQHRHSYAVMQLQRGCDHQWLKNQLGHAPQSTLLYTTYGLYIGAARLTAQQQARHTNPPHGATTDATTRKAVSR